MRTLSIPIGQQVIDVTIAPASLSQSLGTPITIVDEWVRRRIANPHPDQGRPGPMCPFVPAALRWDKLYYALIPGVLTLEKMIGIVSSIGIYFDDTRRCSPRPSLETIICVFGDMSQGSLRQQILDTHEILKDTFVRAGRMLGEFVPDYDMPGIHNPDFRPLTSPVPLLAIRPMVKDDKRFLTQHEEWLTVHAGQFPQPACLAEQVLASKTSQIKGPSTEAVDMRFPRRATANITDRRS